MLTTLLNKIISGHDLTQEEAAELLDALLSDETTEARIAAVLVSLAAKGETVEELAGFAETMRARCMHIATRHREFIDTCGTGGSAVKTINVSTAAAFVVAAAGLPVAKHGNIGVTSKAGSADVLRALGVKVDLPPVRVGHIFDEIGVCFMFAPLHHEATRRVAAVRRDLGVRTIFNLLGPLTNPAGAPYQVIGVSDEGACARLAGALSRLGTRRTWVVRGRDGLDEITLSDTTVVYEADETGVRGFEIRPEDFGLESVPIEQLRGGTAEANAAAILEVLEGRSTGPARDLIAVNAAASLIVSGMEPNPGKAYRMACAAISSGGGLSKLEELRRLTNL